MLNPDQKKLLSEFVDGHIEDIRDFVLDALGDFAGLHDKGALEVIADLGGDDPTIVDVEDDVWDYILVLMKDY